MSFDAGGSAQRRNNPFMRNGSPSSSPTQQNASRPKSALFSSTPTAALATASASQLHGRSQSQSSFGFVSVTSGVAKRHQRVESRNGTPTTATFAPSFIKSEYLKNDQDAVRGIEGENDFSGKRYVWIKDPQHAFIKGWVVKDLAASRILVQMDDGTVGLQNRIRWAKD